MKVAVVGARSAACSVAMATLLDEYLRRHGWSERIEVFLGGIADGAGRAETSDLEMLIRDGFTPLATTCTNVAEDPRILDAADVFVVGGAAEAAYLFEWPQADGKHVLALTDYLGEGAWAIEDPESGFRDFTDKVTEALPHLVRALTAHPISA